MDTEVGDSTGRSGGLACGDGQDRCLANIRTVHIVKSLTTRWRHHAMKYFFLGHGHIAFSEHGGKTGMAMLKYPHIKKNAHTQITHRIPVSKPSATE